MTATLIRVAPNKVIIVGKIHGKNIQVCTGSLQGKRVLSQRNLQPQKGGHHRIHMGNDQRSTRHAGIQYHPEITVDVNESRLHVSNFPYILKNIQSSPTDLEGFILLYVVLRSRLQVVGVSRVTYCCWAADKNLISLLHSFFIIISGIRAEIPHIPLASES